ncbi:MAG: hypothetical protein IKU52_07260 [Clostridia bacterium]|nr:hypothetical protein [Clostridia bacterium]
MGYSKSAYIKAREIIEKRAQEANNTSVLRTAAIYKEIPEVKVIDEELANTALQIVKAIAQGKEGIEKKVDKIRKNNLALQKKTQRTSYFCRIPRRLHKCKVPLLRL